MSEDPGVLQAFMDARDWQEAMHYASFTFENIERVVWALEGENDGPDWLLLVELKGGGYGALRAGCDYTGWDCQAGGDSGKFERLEQAWEWLAGPKRWPGEQRDSRVPPLESIVGKE